MSRRLTKQELEAIHNLEKREDEEHKYLAFVMRAQENDPTNEHVRNAVNTQVNRWSMAYQLLHETIDIIVGGDR